MNSIRANDMNDVLINLYGEARLAEARQRCSNVAAGFVKFFGGQPDCLFRAPGRTELGGNHTDHQHGHVLAAAVDLDLLAAVRANRSGEIRIQSAGYPTIAVDLKELAPKPEEENTSAALIRGVAARLAALGCPLADKGLDCYIESVVPGGSGLSSSAAFEVLIGTILNDLFNGANCDAVEIAQIGQYAENVFFGKPCGLMDQMAASVGGVVAIDLADPQKPTVERINLDLTAQGYALCIMDSGADHADLTAEYAAVTDELKAVCRYFGKDVLRDVAESDFMAALPKLRQTAGDRAVLRAFHFYGEDRRAVAEAAALKRGDFDGFLALVKQSGASSALYLQNVVPCGQTVSQDLLLTLALAEKLLDGRGAVRVHGGGFGGTAQAFVPLDKLEAFRSGMDAVFGAGSCRVVTICAYGGKMIPIN